MRILHHYPLCPFSRKVRFLMYEKKLDFSYEVHKNWDLSESLLKMNPAGTLPVLIDLNGTIISDDTAIVEYIEEAYPEHPFIGKDLDERKEIRRLVSWFDKKFYYDVSYHLFLEKVIKRFHKDNSFGGPNSSVLRIAKHAMNFHFEYIAWLIDRRNWLGGKTFSIADMAAAAHISMIDYFGDVPWEKYPRVKQWYVRVKSRPTFRRFLDDKIPGFSPSLHYANLDF